MRELLLPAVLFLARVASYESGVNLNDTQSAHRSGFVALVGRPNVGKSTLLNQLLGQKVAIVSPKPQTTRHRILGVLNLANAQIAFLDTPGLHRPRSLINKRMVQVAEGAIGEADVVVWVVDGSAQVSQEDEGIARQLLQQARRLCVAVNKIDRVPRPSLLPLLARLSELVPDKDVVPVSAMKGTNVDRLLDQIVALLPLGAPLYDPDTLTDQTERTLVEEAVREQVLLQTRQEVPYAIAVTVEKFEEKEKVTVIHAAVHVERHSQKGIVIGARGNRIKQISQAARQEIEKLLGRRIYLELFVRVQEDWSKDERRLRELGL
jgi:GTP-binding protein Era